MHLLKYLEPPWILKKIEIEISVELQFFLCYYCRLKLIAESEEGADIPDEVEEIDDDEPEPETLKYANRSGSYALCTRAGIGESNCSCDMVKGEIIQKNLIMVKYSK